MTEVLEQDQAAHVVEPAELGGEAAARGGPRRGQRLRMVDFTRPTKFRGDLQRRIVRAIDTFCQTAVTRLSAELRCAIELETSNTTQITWSVAQGELPAGSVSVLLEAQPMGTHMLLNAEMPFVLTSLECLLGGSPDQPPRERRLTEIDLALTRRLFESIVHQLSLVWQDVSGISLEVAGVELHNDSSQVAPVSEPTFVITVESRINKHSASLALLIPWMAIEPIAERLSGRELAQDVDPSSQSEIERAMSAVPVTLRAEVASVELAIDEILALRPGSVIPLGVSADRGITLFAENVKLGRGQAGANGARRAVQIRGTDAGGPA